VFVCWVLGVGWWWLVVAGGGWWRCLGLEVFGVGCVWGLGFGVWGFGVLGSIFLEILGKILKKFNFFLKFFF
jgi:hypothetical protein